MEDHWWAGKPMNMISPEDRQKLDLSLLPLTSAVERNLSGA
jgi:hypothetical protein